MLCCHSCWDSGLRVCVIMFMGDRPCRSMTCSSMNSQSDKSFEGFLCNCYGHMHVADLAKMISRTAYWHRMFGSDQAKTL